eukprot:36514_1
MPKPGEPRQCCRACAQNLAARSEALAVHDGRAGLVVLTLGDPHLLEGAQGRQDGAANPNGVLALRRSHDLDLHRRGSQGRQFLGHALTNSLEHRRPSAQHNIGVQIFPDVDITLHDTLERRVMDAGRLFADEARLEEHLGATEALAANRDDVAIRQLIRLFLVRAL